MMQEIPETLFGHRLPVDLRGVDSFVVLLREPWFDENRYQQAERINGVVQCPDCGLWWPLIQEIDEWTARTVNGHEMWYATGWDLASTSCTECDLMIFDGFEGAFVIRMPKVTEG